MCGKIKCCLLFRPVHRLPPLRLKAMEGSWQYDGDATCAADGMCAVSCNFVLPHLTRDG